MTESLAFDTGTKMTVTVFVKSVAVAIESGVKFGSWMCLLMY